MSQFLKILRTITNLIAAGASVYFVMCHIGAWSQKLMPLMHPDGPAWSLRILAATTVLALTGIYTEHEERPWPSLARWPYLLALGGAGQLLAAGAGALLFNPLPLSVGMTILILICLALTFLVAVVATGFGLALCVQWAAGTAAEKAMRLVRFVLRVIVLVKEDNLARTKAQN